MSKEKDPEKKSSLRKKFMKAAWWVTKATVSFVLAYGVLTGLDYVLFHQMEEGKAFISAITPAAESVLRADIPLLGFSVAGAFQTAADVVVEASANSPQVLAENYTNVAKQAAPGMGMDL